LQYPDSRLYTKAHPVTSPKEARIQKIVADMLETLAYTECCAALAATQLNIELPPAITVINDLDSGEEPLCLINPKIVSASGEVIDQEGCMSIGPQVISAKIKRAQKVIVQAIDNEGHEVEIHAENFLARCLQHEIDHLNGVLFIDYLSSLKRARLEKKIIKLARQ